jgi:arylsulfatase A-like enzyme
MNGVVALWGPGVKRGQELSGPGAVPGPAIIDLAPTILALLGVEIPHDVDGRVLEEAFEPGVLAPRWSEPEPGDAAPTEDPFSLSEEEQAEIAARLRGLGYVG